MPEIGQTCSHDRVLPRLGCGGMGVVYEAQDLRLGRHVAIECPPKELVSNLSALERIGREARAASLQSFSGLEIEIGEIPLVSPQSSRT